MMEAYVASAAATSQDREAFGQLLMDFDSVVDNLSTVYEEARSGDECYPLAEELKDAFGNFVLARKA